MIVLALDCGSSSLEFQVFASDPGSPPAGARRLARGVVERIGYEASLAFQAEGSSATRERQPVPDHEAAVRRVLGWLAAGGASAHRGGILIDAVGHRVVQLALHGSRPARRRRVDAIEALEALAPLHNAPSLAGIRATRVVLGPDVPMVAVFDTAFHATMPERAYRYAIPHELALKHGILTLKWSPSSGQASGAGRFGSGGSIDPARRLSIRALAASLDSVSSSVDAVMLGAFAAPPQAPRSVPHQPR